MARLGIVILNYLNYTDTIECVDSICDMEYDAEGIVIVDNNSGNDSFIILRKRYLNNSKIIVVKTGYNYGFAKGNNIGISIARRKFGVDFVFVVNNDTIFQEKDYFIKLLNCYSAGIGAIGSEIHVKNGITQREITCDISLKGSLKRACNLYLSKCGKGYLSFLLPNVKTNHIVKVLHGCAILLTPDFFQHYKGFYARTFLYFEEPILYLMCKRYGLKQRYVKDTYIYHKEDQSSEMSFQNNSLMECKFLSQSCKYLVWWVLKDKVSVMIKKFRRISDEKTLYESVRES